MTEERIDRCGLNVSQSQRGAYWDVTFYVHFDGHTGMRSVTYRNLSKTEMIDVILANLDDYTPGSVRVDGGQQRQLWSDPEPWPDDAA